MTLVTRVVESHCPMMSANSHKSMESFGPMHPEMQHRNMRSFGPMSPAMHHRNMENFGPMHLVIQQYISLVGSLKHAVL